MADPSAPPAPAGQTPAAASPSAAATYKAPTENRALRMMGIPNLPKKLPSRNWMIFWTLSAALTGAIMYDKREKKRATAKWARVVAPLAKEPIPSPNQLPRRLTIYLESPPADGLRVAQDHFTEYVKPVLAASGLDWEFVQGRKEGDVRAAVSERIRRTRQSAEGHPTEEKTTDELVHEIRQRNGTPEWTGMQGDIIIGRHTWKEYIRGLHEGWLGPLYAPGTTPPEKPKPEIKKEIQPTSEIKDDTEPMLEIKDDDLGLTTEVNNNGVVSTLEDISNEDTDIKTDKLVEDEKKPVEEEKKPEAEEKKSDRPKQPIPYNTTADYPSAVLPAATPVEFSPSTPIPFPHLLGFLNTPTRMYRFLTRRRMADDIGREVAAVCFAAAREYRQEQGSDAGPVVAEQAKALEHEERDWHKDVWKVEEKPKVEKSADENSPTVSEPGTTTTTPSGPSAAAAADEKLWASPVVVDERIGGRMRRFELAPEHEATAASVKVPEEELEGFIRGSFRSLYRWAVSPPPPRPRSSDSGEFE